MKRHELLHSGVKKYICEACQTPFVRLDALQRHHKSEVSLPLLNELAMMLGTDIESVLPTQNGVACIQQITAMSVVAGINMMPSAEDGSDDQSASDDAVPIAGGNMQVA